MVEYPQLYQNFIGDKKEKTIPNTHVKSYLSHILSLANLKAKMTKQDIQEKYYYLTESLKVSMNVRHEEKF